ncbi:hypothetical protein H9W95_01680 [Flavobacterium lindanitolerans]|nr:hypothetical protein [Flavobacterium lindanitolerans]
MSYIKIWPLVYRKQRNYPKAEEYIKKAKSSLIGTSRRDISQVYLEEAKLFLDQKKIMASQNAVRAIFKELIPGYNSKNILPKEKNLYPETLLIDALEVLAQTYTEQKNYFKAIDCYQLTFAIDSRFSTVFFMKKHHYSILRISGIVSKKQSESTNSFSIKRTTGNI